MAYISDLHVDSGPFGREAARLMPELLAELEPDVFVIAGDVSTEMPLFEDTLARFDSVQCHKLFVPGNHDIWVYPGPGRSSRAKYMYELPEVCERTGFLYLPGRPVVIRGLGFAGTIGWYDYSFRDPLLDGEISLDTYRRKQYRGRLWSDLRYARWGASDESVTEELAAQLGRDLDGLEAAGVPIVAVSHHLPFESLVVRHSDNVCDFFSAYLGSAVFGEVILSKPSVKLVICGHTHFERDTTVDDVRVMISPLGYERDRPEGVEKAVKESLRIVDL